METIEQVSMDSTKIMVGIFMGAHLIVNLIIGLVVNDKANLNKGGLQGGPIQRSFSAHTLVSTIVLALIFIIKITGWFPGVGRLLKQDLIKRGFLIVSIPLIIHFILSVILSIVSFSEKDVKKVKELSNIFNGISTAVCFFVLGVCIIPAEKIMSMEEEAKKMKDKALAKAKKAVKGTKTPPAEKTGGTSDTEPTKNPVNVEEAFGNRQRRRNPPKRRRRRKKKY